MFLAALDYAQCPAFEVVHIGDHPIDDILGAHNIGMKTIWVNLNQSHWKTDKKPTATITHLDQLAAAVKSIR
jgi:putative hydrolase of the HAD superfamily